MVELAEVFHRYGPAYRAQFGDRMLPSHHRAMRAIERCRTPALGGQLYTCPDCGETRYQYHSCRNRHCPKCQHEAGERWLARQEEMRLPVPYFMLTFTLPAALRPLARSHQRLFYDLLFRCAAAAVQKLARDPRFVGGQVGLLGVLHTWTRNLVYHPHVHFLAPAGGLTAAGRWRPARADFFLPVQALSRIFRAQFRDALRATPLGDQVPPTVWTQEWVVHGQSVGNGRRAFKYLAPYIFRVALTNNRLVQVADDQVTFRYRPSDTRQTRLCTLSATEFIRRFLQHVLPKGFVKVRYYGFLAPGRRPQLAALRRLLLPTPPPAGSNPAALPPAPKPPPSPPVVYCPTCGQVMLRRPLRPTRGGRPP